MEYKYEIVKYSDKYPAKILLQNKPGKRCNTSLHWHSAIELLYIIDGSLNVKIDNNIIPLKSEDVFLVNSGCLHRTVSPEPEKNIKYFVVLLSYERLLKYYPHIQNYRFVLTQNSAVKQKIRNLLSQAACFFETKPKGYEVKINSLLYDIYYLLVSDCAAHSTEKSQSIGDKEFEYIKSAIEFMGKKYNEEITLNDIASKLGLSASYFSRCFKKITRMPVMHYLSRIRLESALSDIVEENKTVTNAALDNGFTSVKSFIQLCKAVYDCTPGQYKAKYS